MSGPMDGEGRHTSLASLLSEAVKRTAPSQSPKENEGGHALLAGHGQNLAHARCLTLLLLMRLEREIVSDVPSAEGSEWLWGKENAVSTLVKLSASLLKIIEMEYALLPKGGTEKPVPGVSDEDRQIITRYVEKLRSKGDAGSV